MTYMISSDCGRCGVCEFMCPESAIREAPNQFVIRRRLCNGCGECVPYCPLQAIVPEAEFSARQRQTRKAELRAVLG
jgi:ferredoxin